MKYQILLVVIFMSCLLNGQTNKTVKKDLLTGLITTGNGISCDNVFLSNGSEKINRNTFIYGEKFYLNFDNIIGFVKVENKVFPGIELLITNKKGDTIMHNSDLYKVNTEGISINPLLLQTNITTAQPIHSKHDYTFYVKIWDKKSTGTFTAEMDFYVQVNDQIAVNSNNISYEEIYLFSSETGSAVLENNVSFNEKIYFIFEGLNGFYEDDGTSFLGLSMLAKDSEGNIILDEKDLIADMAITTTDLKKLAPNFIFPESKIKNPILCEILIWDKKSDHKIRAMAKLNIK